MLADEVNEVVAVEIGAELIGVSLAAFPFDVDVRVPVAIGTGRVVCFVAGPHAPLIKASLIHRVWFDAEVVDLPLARGTRFITGLTQYVGISCIFVRIEMCPCSLARHIPVVRPAMPKRVLPGQQSDAGGRALRHTPGIVEFHPGCSELVDGGCIDPLCAVATDPLLTQIINQDE